MAKFLQTAEVDSSKSFASELKQDF